MGMLNTKMPSKNVAVDEAKYWSRFEEEATHYGTPIWVDYQKADTPEIPFISFSTDPKIDHLYLGKIKEYVIKNAFKGKVLDLGCGAGWLSLELARKGATVTGIDISKKRIKIAKTHAKKVGVCIDYRVGDINDLSWVKQSTYDVIVNWNTLHHTEHTEKILDGVKRSLKKDGLFISWDHLGDNILMSAVAKLAQCIPNYYKDKVKILGSVHSDSEGIAEVRITKGIVEKYFHLIEYQERFMFSHLIAPVYKYLRYKLHIPIPQILLIFILNLMVPLDFGLSKLFPWGKTYSLAIAAKN